MCVDDYEGEYNVRDNDEDYVDDDDNHHHLHHHTSIPDVLLLLLMMGMMLEMMMMMMMMMMIAIFLLLLIIITLALLMFQFTVIFHQLSLMREIPVLSDHLSNCTDKSLKPPISIDYLHRLSCSFLHARQFL